jgi:hypothetical protein
VVQWFDRYLARVGERGCDALYVIANADYWQASGDRAFLDAAWPSILKAGFRPGPIATATG